MNKAKIVNIEGLTKPELDYLCEHDYIKVGNKYYISKDRAIELVAQLQANDAEQSDSNCNIPFVSGSLHYDEKLLIELWYKRNPCHELNSNSDEDMFWRTAFMVFEDYVREVSRNDR